MRPFCYDWKGGEIVNSFLNKEIRLSALPLTWFFLVFAAMTLLPGYPILCGVFFITLGIYQSFQHAREANDIVYSVLLPMAKRNVVKGKFLFVALIELCGFALMAILTFLRMTVWADALVYRQNMLMNANLFYLGAALLIFGLFNVIFVGGFFKTAYQIGKPFVYYICAAFPTVGAAEALHYLPGMAAVNAFGFDHFVLQLSFLFVGAMVYMVITYLSYRKACTDFEKIDF